jgi:hypothetical protein
LGASGFEAFEGLSAASGADDFGGFLDEENWMVTDGNSLSLAVGNYCSTRLLPAGHGYGHGEGL